MLTTVRRRPRDEQVFDDDDGPESLSSEAAGCCCCCSCCCCHRSPEMRAGCRDLDVHGIKRIFLLPAARSSRSQQARKSSFRRSAWVLVLLILLAFFVYSAVDRIFVYLSEPHFTREFYSLESSSQRLRLPAITVCNLNPLRLSELSKRKWSHIASRDTNHDKHADMNSQAWTSSSLNMSSWDVFMAAGPRIDKLVLSCRTGGSVVPCSHSNFTRSLLDGGLCFTIYPNASRLQLVLNVESYEYPLVSSVISPEVETIGLRVLFHDQSVTGGGESGVGENLVGGPDGTSLQGLSVFSHSVSISPGLSTSISIQQTDVTLLSTFSSPCSQSTRLRESCLSTCRDDLIETICGCRPFWMAGPGDSRFRVCTMKQHMSCVRHYAGDYTSRTARTDNCSCLHPCHYIEYAWDISHTRLFTASWPFHPSSAQSFSSSQRQPGGEAGGGGGVAAGGSAGGGSRSTTSPWSGTAAAVGFSAVTDAWVVDMNSDRCRAANVRSLKSREIWHDDTNEIAELERAMNDVTERLERLQTSFQRTIQDLQASLDELYVRLAFHAAVGLSGIRRSFLDGFVAPWDTVRRRSLEPLVANYYETVSAVERAVKQLMFTAASETVNRKVLYFVADNQLSAKLEIAIQALDNLTKVYYAFLDAKPLQPTSTMASTMSITPDGRYDQHLIPEELLTSVRTPMKDYYTGISENIAGLMEDVLRLKEILRNVYQTNRSRA